MKTRWCSARSLNNGGLVAAVQGLETEVNTFGKQGLKTTKDIADSFAKAGDTTKAKFFQLLSDQGFKTADDIKKALDNPDLFNQLLTDLQNAGDLSGGLATTTKEAGQAGVGAMKNLASATSQQTSALREQTDAVNKLADAYARLSKNQPSGGSTTTTGDENDGAGQDPPPPPPPPPSGKFKSRQIGRYPIYGY